MNFLKGARGLTQTRPQVTPSMKCTVPVFHPRSSCNRTGAHPSILLKEAPTCADADKNASSAAAKKAFPAVVKHFFSFFFFFQRAAIKNARMEKSFKSLPWMRPYGPFSIQTSVVVFNLQPIRKINTWRADSVVKRGGEKNKQRFSQSGFRVKALLTQSELLCHLLSFE